MGKLNHNRPILRLMDAKNEGKHVEDIATAALGRRYLTPGKITQRAADDGQKQKLPRKEPERIRIHQVALAIVDRFRQVGDSRDATLLIEYVTKEEDKDALRKWFLRYGGMVIDSHSGNFRKNRDSAPDPKGGAAKPYWDLKEPAVRRPFDLAVELSAFVSKVRKLARQPVKGDLIQDTLLDGLEKLLQEQKLHP
ncbi:hypothetical protein [Mesorhizobium sp. ES1-1]|uniref:hypothetical protein n=1 Tax=Mesorhizobium sp. ES1-1 TaxID=2876629 RepID=UPI001CCC50CD|nr:hypothetical protein [Mesorhizobium sp. ES1-1]MBZ9675248.1 hypothetical protein [Mesorhizobium sp. ES1-1]